MKNFFLKCLSVIAYIRYPHVKQNYRYFIRDNYYSRLQQIKFIYKDFFLKTRYKVVDWQGEFQVELTYVLPFAYWHYLNGSLSKTMSCVGTNDLYFFSPDHQEKYSKRDATYMFRNYDIPNMTHSISKSFSKWAQVPLKSHYANSIYTYDKPILIIANKYNIEWDKSPINFLDIHTLDKIFSKYKKKYQIIYNRPLSNHIVIDNSEILDLDEYDWMYKEHPEVLSMNDIFQLHKNKLNSFNHLQLMIYANSNHFISVHGGAAALASYFGGINIIFSIGGLEGQFDEYNSIFPALSNAKIFHATTRNEILDLANTYY